LGVGIEEVVNPPRWLRRELPLAWESELVIASFPARGLDLGLNGHAALCLDTINFVTMDAVMIHVSLRFIEKL
jgi:hypothetical protein